MVTLEQRREAREAVSHPGKFEGESPMAPLLWDIVLDGGADDECSCEFEPLARVGRWTIYESDYGFVSAIRHDSVEGAQAVIDECREESAE